LFGKNKGKYILKGGFMRKIKELSVVYLIGSVLYSIIEILWRGYTHWTMALTGGACFSGIYLICEKFKKSKMLFKCLCSSTLITTVEFLVGCIVNKLLKMNVWDYSKQKFNLLGQICLLYSVLWFFLSIPAVFMCGVLKRRIK
jgi:uncharacterized membrane protein